MSSIQNLVDRIVSKYATTTMSDNELHQEIDRKMIRDMDIYARLRILEVALEGAEEEHKAGMFTKRFNLHPNEHGRMVVGNATRAIKAAQDYFKERGVVEILGSERESEKRDVPTGSVSSHKVDPGAFETIKLKKEYDNDPLRVAYTVYKHIEEARKSYANYRNMAESINDKARFFAFDISGLKKVASKIDESMFKSPPVEGYEEDEDRPAQTMAIDYGEPDTSDSLKEIGDIGDISDAGEDPLIVSSSSKMESFEEMHVPSALDRLIDKVPVSAKVYLKGNNITDEIKRMSHLKSSIISSIAFVRPLVVWRGVSNTDEPSTMDMVGMGEYISKVHKYTVEFMTRNKKRLSGEEEYTKDVMVVDPNDPVYGTKGLLSDENTGVFRALLGGASSVTRRHTWLDSWDVAQSLTFGLSLGDVVEERKKVDWKSLSGDDLKDAVGGLTESQLKERIKEMKEGNVPLDRTDEENKEFLGFLEDKLSKHTKETNEKIKELEKIVDSSGDPKKKEKAKEEIKRLKNKVIKIPYTYDRGATTVGKRRSVLVTIGLHLHDDIKDPDQEKRIANLRNYITGENLKDGEKPLTARNIGNIVSNMSRRSALTLINREDQKGRKWNNAGTGNNTETDEESNDRQSGMFDRDTSSDSLIYKMGSDPNAFLPGNRVWSSDSMKSVIMAITENMDKKRNADNAYLNLIKFVEDISHSDKYDFHGDRIEIIKTGETQPVYGFLAQETGLNEEQIHDFLVKELPGRARLLFGISYRGKVQKNKMLENIKDRISGKIPLDNEGEDKLESDVRKLVAGDYRVSRTKESYNLYQKLEDRIKEITNSGSLVNNKEVLEVLKEYIGIGLKSIKHDEFKDTVPKEIEESNIYQKRNDFEKELKDSRKRIVHLEKQIERTSNLLRAPLKKIKEATAQGKDVNVPQDTLGLIESLENNKLELGKLNTRLGELREIVKTVDDMVGIAYKDDDLSIENEELIEEAKRELSWIKRISKSVGEIVGKGVPDLILEKNVFGGYDDRKPIITPGENLEKRKRLENQARQWESEYRSNHMSNVERIGILESTRGWRKDGDSEGDKTKEGKFKFENKDKKYTLSDPVSLGWGTYPDLSSLDHLGDDPVDLGVPVGRVEPAVENYYEIGKKKKEQSVKLTRGVMDSFKQDEYQRDHQRIKSILNRDEGSSLGDKDDILVDDVLSSILIMGEKNTTLRREIESKFKAAESRLSKLPRSKVNAMFEKFASDLNKFLSAENIKIGSYKMKKSPESVEQRFHLFMLWCSIQDAFNFISETPNKFGIANVYAIGNGINSINRSSKELVEIFDKSKKFGKYVIPGEWDDRECKRILRETRNDFESNLMTIHRLEDVALRRRSSLTKTSGDDVPETVYTEGGNYRGNMMTHDEWDRYYDLKSKNTQIINVQRRVMKLSPPGEYAEEKEKLGMSSDNQYNQFNFSRSGGHPVEAISIGLNKNRELTKEHIDEIIKMLDEPKDDEYLSPNILQKVVRKSPEGVKKTAFEVDLVRGIVSKYLRMN